ncbi:hypothetical protein SLS62_009552 [Diatrype stigma]|uniref:Erythromycin esterase n=1 Tax=Diatrype stigma TaxID=117547 RepID=A0AAN9UE69_9PEZI
MAQRIPDALKGAVTQLPPIESSSFGSHFDSYGRSRIVLIGDGSHGTSEFYRARAAITKRLIEKHGFNLVAIEADWPDARNIDHYVRQHPRRGRGVPIRVFDHFPRWMWRNTEVQEFVDWLRQHNAMLPPQERTSFNGLDLYSMAASTRAVIEYLEWVDPDLARAAKKRYGCLEPWLDDPQEYGRSAFYARSAKCESRVVRMLSELLVNRIALASHPDEDGKEAFVDAEMNARAVRDAERYYRAMFYGDSTSWNLRDEHMFAVLARLLQLRPGAKAVVWAHNSHVGDARASSMGAPPRRELNLGQLCRERFGGGGEVSLLGCGTHAGTVAAADDWDEPMRVMDVRPSRPDSYEAMLHGTGIPSLLLDTRGGGGGLRLKKLEPKLQRFIGVVYRPETEMQSHYMRTTLQEQYDGFVWFDRTSAVHAFETTQPKEPLALGETYPFGM